MDDIVLLSDLLDDSNLPKEFSVKVKLFEQDYFELKEIARRNEITLKKLVNKSIQKAIDDIDDYGFYERKRRVLVLEDEMVACSLKIKSKHYKTLKVICENQDIRMKDMVRDIILYYPFEYYGL